MYFSDVISLLGLADDNVILCEGDDGFQLHESKSSESMLK
mgnify:CR=1 FL=1